MLRPGLDFTAHHPLSPAAADAPAAALYDDGVSFLNHEVAATDMFQAAAAAATDTAGLGFPFSPSPSTAALASATDSYLTLPPHIAGGATVTYYAMPQQLGAVTSSARPMLLLRPTPF